MEPIHIKQVDYMLPWSFFKKLTANILRSTHIHTYESKFDN